MGDREEMDFVLKKYFGYSGFRAYQKEVIQKVTEGRDCLVVMATGSGKSLCYQVPPLIVGKTAIVVSPLISLMQDQVMTLKQRGIRAGYLGSAQTDSTAQTKAENGYFHLLFLTPEKACLLPASFWLNLLKLGICLFAVDEAHCISEWGHDFRVEYKQLDKLRAILSDVPFVALTATATENVRVDIINSLKMKDPYVAIGSFDRKNIFYGVKHHNHSQSFLDELVQEISRLVANAGSTIIYCLTIKEIFKSLQKAGIKAGIYHGQMGSKAREESHRLFIRDELQVMVATIAFGMGIDKPNVRHVIHYGCPKSIEAYYQESGRCGRDGMASVCWLYYTGSDFAKAEFYCGESQSENHKRAIRESLMAGQRYCLLTTCRRKFLLDHFGEKLSTDNCGNCDNCLVSRRERDMSKESFLLMASIQSCGGNWGLKMPIDVLRGSRSKKIVDAQFDKLPLHGLGKSYSSNWWKALAHQLISHGYLMETVKDVYRTVSVSPKGKQHLSSAGPDHQSPLYLPLTDEMLDDEDQDSTSGEIRKVKNLAPLDNEGFSEAEAQLYRLLLEERMKLARAIGTAPYAVCGDETVKRIALIRPSTKARFGNIDGVNQHLVRTHGDYLLNIIRHLSESLNLSLDGEASFQTAIPKAHPVLNNQRKIAPAKYDAWKMWHADGLSVQKIANFPGRPAPIKEQTVLQYLLDAAQEGFEIDWTRLCSEIELTHQMFSDICDAVSKIGSREKLKPIKDKLPEETSYTHIRTCLVMQSYGISPEVVAPCCNPQKTAELSSEAVESCLIDACHTKSPHEFDMSGNSMVHFSSSKNLTSAQGPKLDLDCNDDLVSSKRHKLVHKGSSTASEATEDLILNWLKNHDEGVPLSAIVEHFHGSNKEHVVKLLGNLESDFMVFRKKDLYRLM
ncbi:uncharacterized protein LOC111285809 isoform X2 [Durio zibethinus]|uniref:ATP-dependent DNA helicase n=1 Tax=Durio zibethinus TaxID=66656 RepID=A0A6P5XT78_DURZI|nr:uncharacterized protein LOC111285809 isoform X2 [Durio zibethinus]